MATDTEQLILSISADTAQIKRALSRLPADAKTAAQGVEQAFNRIDVSRSMRAMQADAKNLTFQLNDITSGLLGGQSPFQVMVQQGSQVSQVLSGAGGVSNAVKLLGSSFVGLLSPVSLATSAFIFAAGYAVQYFTSLLSGSESSENELKKQADLIDRIAKEWGDALPALKAYNDEQQRQTNTKEVIEAQTAAINKQKQKLRELANEIGPTVANLINMFSRFGNMPGLAELSDDWVTFSAELEAGTATLEDVDKIGAQVIATLEKLPVQAARDLAKTFRDETLPQLRKTVEIMQALQKEQKKAIPDLEKQKEFNKALEEMGQIGQPQLTEMQKLMVAYGEAVRSATTDQEKLNALLALMAGIGRLDAEEIIDANQKVAKSATEFIKREEGFRPTPYPDPKDLAIGYGMHQYVTEAGDVIDITREMTTTVAEANEQLARQIPRYQATIIKAIGADIWAGLEENQQAALTSIAWNYGHLPDSVAAAIRRGDHGQAAVAIRNLSANPERRAREAQLYATGSAPAADALKEADAQKTLAEQRAEANVKLQEMITTEQQEIELKQKINAINADLTLSEDERALAIARVTAEAAKEAEVEKLVNQAKEAGLAITPELLAQYNALAQAKVNAIVQDKEIAVANRQAADAEKQRTDALKQLNQQAQQMVSGAITGFIQDIRNGVEAGEAFNNMLNRIIDSLINMAVQMAVSNLFKSFGGIGGVAAPVLHAGGIVGQTASPRRMVDPRVFIGAPSMASGGLVGGEVPIIAHRGEMVIPKNMVGRGGSVQNTYSMDNAKINVDMSATGRVAADSDSAKQFGENVQKIIQVEMVRQSRPGGLLRRVPG